MSNKTRPRKNKVYLGIDPGSTLIGFGVIEDLGSSMRCLEYGTIITPGPDRSVAYLKATAELNRILSQYQPDLGVIEKLFFFKNQKTVMAVSEMRGVLLLALATAGVPFLEFTPLQVKQTVCNYGLADKKQVQRVVQMLLKLTEPIKPDDAADALALAICGATRPG